MEPIPPSTGRTRPVALSGLVVALALAACAPADPSGGPRTATATLHDEMRIELSPDEFRAGETVRIEVTNAGAVRHELFLGDEEAQRQHAAEMADGGMSHDEPGGVSVEPGATETLEFTFAEAGEILAACHEPGHYEAGMVTAVTVNDR